MSGNLVEKLRLFLSHQSCVIVESSPALALSMRAKLVEIGVPNAQIWTAPKLEAAKQMIELARPTMLIIEHEMEGRSTKSLIDSHHLMHGSDVRVLFITSRNANSVIEMDDAGLEADSHFVKPFSADAFRERLLILAKNRVEPSAFLARLEAGKALLAKGETEKAAVEFDAALMLDPKQVLGWFYKGEIARKQKKQGLALECYRAGLRIQPTHYRCAIAEFETLQELEKPADAFALVDSFATRFQVPGNRLARFFELAVSTQQFDYMPRLYNLFRSLENRSSDLIGTVEKAFLDAGRLLLETGDVEKATALFETGIVVASRRIDYVGLIVREFGSRKLTAAAASFFSKAPPEENGSPAFEQLAFYVDHLTITGDRLINRGRELIQKGYGTPEIFHVVVRSFAEAGKETHAESTIGKAIETYPDLRAQLYQVLADHLPKQAA